MEAWNTVGREDPLSSRVRWPESPTYEVGYLQLMEFDSIIIAIHFVISDDSNGLLDEIKVEWPDDHSLSNVDYGIASSCVTLS